MSLPATMIHYLCGFGSGDAGTTDTELLGRFIEHRDEAAFALLLRRHGGMVYGTCRRLLPTDQDAEDAFQATFLVLAEKARTITPREAVGNWLYGVARRAALLARRSIARRRERMAELTDLLAPGPDPLAELRAALDVEVGRLADVLRTVIVLCDLEGRTRKEAASILGWPEGTVAGRLARARRLLARRLARHAPAISVAAVLSGTAARAPGAVLALTAGERPVPAAVAALTREVLANTTGGTLMKTLIAVLVLGGAGLGMSLGAGQEKGKSPVPAATDRATPLPGGGAGPAPTQKDVKKRSFPEAMNQDFKKLVVEQDAAKAALKGTWEYVGPDEVHRWTFTDELAVNEVVYTKTNRVISKSVYGYHINPRTTPPEINFHTETDLILGIYRLKGEQLTVASSGAWASALVRPKGFNSEDCGLENLPLNTRGFTRVPK
ncbi:MAG: sigma-70 family RNA polymerase sigma factor [Isosphaeraceae bacterium]